MNNVRDFGAKGDGITSDTAAIQRAIDAGGIVFFPPGCYRSGTLYLRSNGGLEFEQGATLLAGDDSDTWNAPDFCPQNRCSEAEKNNGRHLIVALNCENISIRGGRIDGNSSYWLNEKNPENPFFLLKPRNGQMLFFCECRGIRIQDCELSNASYWHCFLHGCEDAILSGLFIHGDPRVLCNDGIDIDCCSRVTVSNCLINTGDDALTLRGNSKALGGERRVCEYVTVSNCVLSGHYADGIRLGVGDGIIRHCTFSNLLIHSSIVGIELTSSYNGEAGVDMEGIVFDQIRMNVERPFLIMLIAQHCKKPVSPVIRDIDFSRIRGRAELSSYIRGNGLGRISDIRFSDVILDYYGNGTAPYLDADGCWGKDSTDAAFQIEEAGSLLFDRVQIRWQGGSGWKYELEAKNSPDIQLRECNFTKGTNYL